VDKAVRLDEDGALASASTCESCFGTALTLVVCRCPNGSATPGQKACANPEAESADTVVSQLTLEVDERFSFYGMVHVTSTREHEDGGGCGTGLCLVLLAVLPSGC
jgi:hypothetical protein